MFLFLSTKKRQSKQQCHLILLQSTSQFTDKWGIEKKKQFHNVQLRSLSSISRRRLDKDFRILLMWYTIWFKKRNLDFSKSFSIESKSSNSLRSSKSKHFAYSIVNSYIQLIFIRCTDYRVLWLPQHDQLKLNESFGQTGQ